MNATVSGETSTTTPKTGHLGDDADLQEHDHERERRDAQQQGGRRHGAAHQPPPPVDAS